MIRTFLIVLAVILSNLILIPLWLWWGAEVGQVTDLTCTRAEPTLVNCELRQARTQWTSFTPQVDQLTSLQSVEFREECAKDCYYQMVLQAINQQVTVKATESDQNRAADLQAFIDGRLDIKTFEASFGGSRWDLAGWLGFLFGLELAATSPFWLEKVGEWWNRSALGRRVSGWLQ